MPLFYRGAPRGSYWHGKDARLHGFTPHSPHIPSTVNRMVQHIAQGTAASPFVSLTRSYAVAWAYAVLFSRVRATAAKPAYVYEVEINDPVPPQLSLLDPINEVTTALSDPLNGCPYHHDGLPQFLLGVVDPSGMKHHLSQLPPCPPLAGAATRSHPAGLSDELRTLVHALRDSELLALGTIPAPFVTNRYDVF